VPDPVHPRRPGRGDRSRPSPAALGAVRVDQDFAQEYPDGDSSATEAHATLARAGQALLQELERCVKAALDVPQAAATALAVIDGASSPLTPSEIGDRMLVASATMTSTLDLLEHRGWIVRRPNPDDRRSVLIEITADGHAVTDRMLPGIRQIELNAMSALTPAERHHLLELLSRVLDRVAGLAEQPPQPLEGRRVRPSRPSTLTPP